MRLTIPLSFDVVPFLQAYHGSLRVHLHIFLDKLSGIGAHVFPGQDGGLGDHSDVFVENILRVAVVKENQVPTKRSKEVSSNEVASK